MYHTGGRVFVRVVQYCVVQAPDQVVGGVVTPPRNHLWWSTSGSCGEGGGCPGCATHRGVKLPLRGGNHDQSKHRVSGSLDGCGGIQWRIGCATQVPNAQSRSCQCSLRVHDRKRPVWTAHTAGGAGVEGGGSQTGKWILPVWARTPKDHQRYELPNFILRRNRKRYLEHRLMDRTVTIPSPNSLPLLKKCE